MKGDCCFPCLLGYVPSSLLKWTLHERLIEFAIFADRWRTCFEPCIKTESTCKASAEHGPRLKITSLCFFIFIFQLLMIPVFKRLDLAIAKFRDYPQWPVRINFLYEYPYRNFKPNCNLNWQCVLIYIFCKKWSATIRHIGSLPSRNLTSLPKFDDRKAPDS